MVTNTQYVIERSEYIEPDGSHKFRVVVSDSAPGGQSFPGQSRTLSGILPVDAAALTPGVELTVTYAPAV